ncbi:MAG: hypothetical protein IPF54_25580 [Draconibacterium sp.]|nr:hypothetical protein [Draconibacterium sp.]
MAMAMECRLPDWPFGFVCHPSCFWGEGLKIQLIGMRKSFLIVLFSFAFGFAYFSYNTFRCKLDKELVDEADKWLEDKFKYPIYLSKIFANLGLLLIAALCVFLFSCFPVLKYAPDLMVNEFGVDKVKTGRVFFPDLYRAMLLTPFLGLYDKKERCFYYVLGSVLLMIVHVIFYLPLITSVVAAFQRFVILGTAFSLVPSSMWPSLPKKILKDNLEVPIRLFSGCRI